MIEIDKSNLTKFGLEDKVEKSINFMLDSIKATCTDPIAERCLEESKSLDMLYLNIKSQMGFVGMAYDKIIDAIAQAIKYFYQVGAGPDIFKDNYCSTLDLNYIFSLIGIGIILILSYLALDFVARILNNTKYSVLVRKEIGDIIILIPILILLLNLPCVIKDNDVSIHQRSLFYIHSAIFSTLVSILPIQYYAGTVGAHSVSIVQNLGGGAPQTAPLAVQYYESSIALAKQSMTFLALSFVWVGTLAFLFDIFTYGFVKYLLPIAIILRFIPFTRSLGGGLIGLIIASNLFIPIILTINYHIIKMFGPVYFDIENNVVKLKFNPWIEMVLSLFISVFFFTMMIEMLMHIRLFINTLNLIKKFRAWQSIRHGIRNFLSSIINLAGAGNTGVMILSSISLLSSTSLRIFAFQIPLLLIIVILITAVIIFNIILPTITFLFLTSTIKYVSGLFGEEFDLANLTRLI